MDSPPAIAAPIINRVYRAAVDAAIETLVRSTHAVGPGHKKVMGKGSIEHGG